MISISTYNKLFLLVTNTLISDLGTASQEQTKASLILPPIFKPPKYIDYPRNLTKKVELNKKADLDQSNIKARAMLSLRMQYINKKHLQSHEKYRTKLRSQTQLDLSLSRFPMKNKLTLSKPNRLKIPQKPVFINQNLMTLKHQYKLREQSIDKYLSPPENLQKYKMLSHLGKGSFSVVSLAIDKQTNNRFAIKTYCKVDEIQEYKFDNIYKQITHLSVLKHQNIVQLHQVIMDKKKIMLVMEDAGKTSLAGLLRKNKNCIAQSETKAIFRQILQGIKYCHQQRICHRDIKLQNVLINQENIVKLIDFGFSSKFSHKLSTYCGTAPYMSPELTYKLPYQGEPADMWALGVLLYLILHGKFPFRANTQRQLYRLIQQGKLQFGEGISMQAKQMITKLLKVNIHDRLTAEKALDMPWLRIVQKNSA